MMRNLQTGVFAEVVGSGGYRLFRRSGNKKRVGLALVCPDDHGANSPSSMHGQRSVKNQPNTPKGGDKVHCLAKCAAFVMLALVVGALFGNGPWWGRVAATPVTEYAVPRLATSHRTVFADHITKVVHKDGTIEYFNQGHGRFQGP
jgi:hypothetical protein